MAEEKVPRHWPSRLVRPYQHTLQGVSARRAASSTFLSSGRPHLPEVMLGVLVVVLGRDLVTAHGCVTRQRKVAFVALLRIARDSSAMTAAGGRTLSAIGWDRRPCMCRVLYILFPGSGPASAVVLPAAPRGCAFAARTYTFACPRTLKPGTADQAVAGLRRWAVLWLWLSVSVGAYRPAFLVLQHG